MEQQQAGLGEQIVERISRSRNEPQWLTKFRFNALREYETIPEEQSNLYTKYGLNLRVGLENIDRPHKAATEGSADLFQVARGIESGYYYATNGKEIIASKNVAELAQKGIVFCDLNEALERHERILRRVFDEKAILPSSDKYAALNSAVFNQGWLVYVPKNVILTDPLRVRFYLDTDEPSFSQTWIVAESGAQVSLITENYGAEVAGVSGELIESYLEDNASVQYSNVQDYSEETTVLANKKAVCKKDSRMSWVLAYFGAKSERSRLESVFTGDGASCEDVEVVFGDNYQRYDLVSDLTHEGEHTKGRILCNSVLRDQSRSIFKGMIRIGKHAKNANAYLAGHAILLSPNAKSDAIPGLEILTNEVKATHSASVAQIDQDQIFYMMTRGIPEEEAKKFIVLGFLEPGISRIQSEELRDTMHDLIEAKWYRQKGLIQRQKKEILFEETEEDRSKPKDIFEGHYKYR
jgi:FeS assembly protein SufD